MGRISGDVYLVSNTEDVFKLQVKNPQKLSYISQTTLSVDDTKVVIEALKKDFQQSRVQTSKISVMQPKTDNPQLGILWIMSI